MSTDCLDILTRVLVASPGDRMSMDEIKTHTWFLKVTIEDPVSTFFIVFCCACGHFIAMSLLRSDIAKPTLECLMTSRNLDCEHESPGRLKYPPSDGFDINEESHNLLVLDFVGLQHCSQSILSNLKVVPV